MRPRSDTFFHVWFCQPMQFNCSTKNCQTWKQTQCCCSNNYPDVCYSTEPSPVPLSSVPRVVCWLEGKIWFGHCWVFTLGLGLFSVPNTEQDGHETIIQHQFDDTLFKLRTTLMLHGSRIQRRANIDTPSSSTYQWREEKRRPHRLVRSDNCWVAVSAVTTRHQELSRDAATGLSPHSHLSVNVRSSAELEDRLSKTKKQNPLLPNILDTDRELSNSTGKCETVLPCLQLLCLLSCPGRDTHREITGECETVLPCPAVSPVLPWPRFREITGECETVLPCLQLLCVSCPALAEILIEKLQASVRLSFPAFNCCVSCPALAEILIEKLQASVRLSFPAFNCCVSCPALAEILIEKLQASVRLSFPAFNCCVSCPALAEILIEKLQASVRLSFPAFNCCVSCPALAEILIEKLQASVDLHRTDRELSNSTGECETVLPCLQLLCLLSCPGRDTHREITGECETVLPCLQLLCLLSCPGRDTHREITGECETVLPCLQLLCLLSCPGRDTHREITGECETVLPCLQLLCLLSCPGRDTHREITGECETVLPCLQLLCLLSCPGRDTHREITGECETVLPCLQLLCLLSCPGRDTHREITGECETVLPCLQLLCLLSCPGRDTHREITGECGSPSC